MKTTPLGAPRCRAASREHLPDAGGNSWSAMARRPSCRPPSAVHPSQADSFYLRPWWAPSWAPLPLFYLMCHPIEALATQVIGDWNEKTHRPPSPSSCVRQNPTISRPHSRRWAPPRLLLTLLPPFWASIGPLGRRPAPITAGQELPMDRTKFEGDACFVIRALEKKKIPTKDRCLVPFVENPYRDPTFTHKAHLSLFIDLTLSFILFASTI
jgi:hypothetical protein